MLFLRALAVEKRLTQPQEILAQSKQIIVPISIIIDVINNL